MLEKYSMSGMGICTHLERCFGKRKAENKAEDMKRASNPRGGDGWKGANFSNGSGSTATAKTPAELWLDGLWHIPLWRLGMHR